MLSNWPYCLNIPERHQIWTEGVQNMVWSFYYCPLSNLEALEQENTWRMSCNSPNTTQYQAQCLQCHKQGPETHESGLDVIEAVDQETWIFIISMESLDQKYQGLLNSLPIHKPLIWLSKYTFFFFLYKCRRKTSRLGLYRGKKKYSQAVLCRTYSDRN